MHHESASKQLGVAKFVPFHLGEFLLPLLCILRLKKRR
jgi:hypothetical protein